MLLQTLETLDPNEAHPLMIAVGVGTFAPLSKLEQKGVARVPSPMTAQ
jgi:hypothetical protein